MRIKYEYKVEKFYAFTADLENILNPYGEDGWELLDLSQEQPVMINDSGSIPAVYRAVFKRPKE